MSSLGRNPCFMEHLFTLPLGLLGRQAGSCCIGNWSTLLFHVRARGCPASSLLISHSPGLITAISVFEKVN